MFKRTVRLPPAGTETFFLWGPRQTGKTTLLQDHPRVGQRVVVCLESKPRRTEDGILIIPAGEFCARLRAGEFF